MEQAMSNYELIRDAILQKMVIVADYKGYRRELCPHCLGRKKGNLRALLYQCGGYTSKGLVVSGSDSNWRCMDIEELEIVEIRSGDFQSVSQHSQSQKCIDIIEYQVSY